MNHWKKYQPSQSLPWNIQRVNHLHRRAAFGATWGELQRDLHDGVEASVSRLLEGEARSYSQRDDFESMSRIIGESAVRSEDEQRLKAWWQFRCLFTPDPLQEKLTLMWHNHFATSNLKVQDLQLMLQQNELLRQHARGPFGQILRAILLDPAMLIWLDASSNRQGHPNENLARELMELFTLGIGNYSEIDVKQAARALTGWSIKAGEVSFKPEHHDSEIKTVLGQTARLNASSLVELLLEHEATSRRLAWRLCDLLMGEQIVSAAAMEELATGLRDHQLDIGWAVATILRSELFFSGANIGSRVSTPVEHIVSCTHSLELLDKPPSTLILADWCSRLGQELFRPPNVGGWPGGRGWLNSRTIIGRANFGAALLSGELHSPTQPADLTRLVSTYCEQSGPTPLSTAQLFETLLLSVPRMNISAVSSDDPREIVGELLSCPQACLT